MEMQDPFFISASLNPALKFEDGTLEYDGSIFIIYFGDNEYHEVQGYRPGAANNLQDMFADICGFLHCWADGLISGYDEHDDLFPVENKTLRAWAIKNNDELSIMGSELEERSGLLVE